MFAAVISHNAHAKDICDRAYQDGQLQQKQKQLIDARKSFSTCVNVCTSGSKAEKMAQEDCSNWLSKLDIPSVVLTSTDGNGTKLTDVSVLIDGRTRVPTLDGKAIEIDPGRHTFVFLSRNGLQKTIEQVVDEGKQAQEVSATFGVPTPVTPQTAPPSGTTAPSATTTPARPGVRHVSFMADDSNTWQLATSEGTTICTLPCSTDLIPEHGYQVRSTRGRATFLGTKATGQVATVSGPVGSTSWAAATVVLSAITVGVGAGFYFAGNTQKCGYGKSTDSDGNTKYAVEIQGACNSTQVPSGYAAGSGEDEGNTAGGNRTIGLVVGSIGAAGIVAGSIWWLASRNDPKIEWTSAQSDSARSFRLGVAVRPGALAIHGTW
jgi:hypothetical protein